MKCLGNLFTKSNTLQYYGLWEGFKKLIDSLHPKKCSKVQ